MKDTLSCSGRVALSNGTLKSKLSPYWRRVIAVWKWGIFSIFDCWNNRPYEKKKKKNTVLIHYFWVFWSFLNLTTTFIWILCILTFIYIEFEYLVKVESGNGGCVVTVVRVDKNITITWNAKPFAKHYFRLGYHLQVYYSILIKSLWFLPVPVYHLWIHISFCTYIHAVLQSALFRNSLSLDHKDVHTISGI